MSAAQFDPSDPMARPVVAAQAELAREDLAAGEIERCVTEAFAYAEEASEEIARHVEPLRPALACAAGCAACCHGTTVLASPPEVLHLAAHLVASFAGEELAGLRARVAEAAAHARTQTMEERAVARRPCPLLDVATGRCRAYEARPLSCRAFHSYDKSACERELSAATLTMRIPSSATVFKVRHAVSLGVMAGAHSLGLDAMPVELTSALDEALGGDLRAKWLAGERVFAPTIASRFFHESYRQVLDPIARALDDTRGAAPPAAGAATGGDAEAEARRAKNRKKRERRRR